jgi:hypothetical protein
MTALRCVDFGEIAGNTAATVMPTVACDWVMFKAQADNAGNAYIGFSDVTKAAGTEDVTSGYQLDAGERTPWLPCANLNSFYRITDNAGDDLSYIAMVG